MSVTHTIPKQRMKAHAGHRTAGHHEELSIAVARLLAVALQLASCGQPYGRTVLWPTPARYRTWPMVESEMETHGQRVRFYVCPEAATLGDDQPFPVGTVFVVEIWSIDAGQAQLLSQFFMGEYAGVTATPSKQARYGAWISMMSRPEAGAPQGDSTASSLRSGLRLQGPALAAGKETV